MQAMRMHSGDTWGLQHLKLSQAITKIPPRVKLPHVAAKWPVVRNATAAPRAIGAIPTAYIGGLMHKSHNWNLDSLVSGSVAL